MKKIIFLVLFLKSFLFGVIDCSTYNPNTDKVSNLQQYNPGGTTSKANQYFCNNDRVYYYFACTTYDGGLTYSCSYRNEYWTSTVNACPSGQYVVNNVCVDYPTCSDGQYFDTTTYSCEPLPPDDLDDDLDGIPNKCDPDYVDYLSMDCDGDGTNNDTDTDIDGDGLLNGNDPNPYDDGSSSGTSDTPCPSTSYNITPVKTLSECSMSNPLFFPVPDGELRYVSNVYWDECRQSCMAKVGICPYGQVIKDGVCKSVVPDEGDCLGTSNCYITSFGVDTSKSCFKNCYCSTTLDPNPQTPYFTQEVSCSSVEDDKATIDDLKSTVDINTTLPDDLLKDSNATYDLDVSASMKVALDSYAGSKEFTQLELLSESKIQSLQLVNANTNLKGINDTLENFSAVSTSNQGAINNTLKGIDSGIDISNVHLGSIDDKMTTNNSLLEDIKDLLDSDSNTSAEESSSLDFLSSEIGSILSRYTIDLGGGGCSSIVTVSTSLHGRELFFLSQSTIDKLPVSEMRALIIFLFTITGLTLAFRGN